MCISSNTYDKNYKVDLLKLESIKNPEEDLREQELVNTAEGYLENLGIKIKTDYGYYRYTYDILKDLGEYLTENNIYKVDTISRITTIEEEFFTPAQVRKMTPKEVKANYDKILMSMKYWN
jgi:hypothetical protein